MKPENQESAGSPSQEESIIDQQQAAQDLHYIRQVIEQTRWMTMLSKSIFFIWGIVIWLLVFLTYAFHLELVGLSSPTPPAYINWLEWAILTFAFVYTVVHLMRIRRHRVQDGGQAIRADNRILGFVWIGFTVNALLLTYFGPLILGFLNVTGIHSGMRFVGLSASLAYALFVTSGLNELRVLKWVAMVCWLGAALLLFTPEEWVLFIFGLFVGTGFLVTGMVLHHQSKVSHDG